MTRQREDEHSTQFGLWLRFQKDIDSSLGFITTNLDYIWENYKTGMFMLIEEKRYGSIPRRPQSSQFKSLDERLSKLCDPLYLGFHLIVFSETNPGDSDKIWIDGKLVTKEYLLKFLRFESDKNSYKSYHHLDSANKNVTRFCQ